MIPHAFAEQVLFPPSICCEVQEMPTGELRHAVFSFKVLFEEKPTSIPLPELEFAVLPESRLLEEESK